MLCSQYNYRLAQRFNWYDETRCRIDACPLMCLIVPVEEIFSSFPVEYIIEHGYINWKALQQSDLPQTKVERPWYKDIHSQVLQDCIHRVDKTFERYTSGDKNGKRSGRPRFKSRSRYRSFTYTQAKQDCIDGNRIKLPKIGNVKMVLHRPLPDGFKIKTATVIHKADGWYVTLSLQDDTVPTLSPDIDFTKVAGIDVGLKDFLVMSDEAVVPIPQFARKSERRRKVLNKALSRKKRKGTKRRQSSGKKLSKHSLQSSIRGKPAQWTLRYQKVARQRKDFHYNIANKLLDEYDVIAHEALNIKGLAKTRLSKSILDAGWGNFIEIVTRKVRNALPRSCRRRPPAGSAAENAGKITVAVNPNGTTQNCSNCGVKVPKTLKDRVHKCSCGLELDRDFLTKFHSRETRSVDFALNAAINIRKLAEGHPVSKARGDLSDSRSVKREALTGLLAVS